MNDALQNRIEDYLDGVLDDETARHFEQDLLKEEVASEFREALLLRELLADLEPEHPPGDLVRRIESALALNHRLDPGPQAGTSPRGRLDGLVATVRAGVRWPGYVLAGLMGGPVALKRSASGLQTIGYSLGPLREPARRGIRTLRLPRKPLWKIALNRMWQEVSS